MHVDQRDGSMSTERSTRRRPLVRALASLLLSASACRQFEGVAQVASDLGREEFRISVLTLNLRGVHEHWGGQNEGSDATIIAWRDRYERLAAGLQNSQIVPDVITLQEVWGYKKCPVTGYAVQNYDTLFELIRRLRTYTGIEYRIAYLMVQPVRQGLCSLWTGNALLYNPQRIRNTVPRPPSEEVFAYDTTKIVDVHLRESLPCTDVAPGFETECSLIDGSGLAWQVVFGRKDGRRVFGPTFVQLELERQRGNRFHIYSEHLDFNDYPAAKLALKDIVDKMEARFGEDRLYPPIMTGDFNIGLGDMLNETTAGPLEAFGIAGYTGNDVMGVLVGDRDKFPSRFGLNLEQAMVLPMDQRDPSNRYCGGSVESLWSDHCAILVRFAPSE